MKRYQSPIPRAALTLAAVGLTAITMGTWVVAPAKMEPGSPNVRASVTPAASEVAPTATRVEVVAVRQPTLITVLARHIQTATKRKQPS